MNRSADWFHQAEADWRLAELSAASDHHEWACFASHQAVEKALKALHLRQGQQVWGHGLGRSFQDLPDGARLALNQAIPDLVHRLRVLDVLYIPDSLPQGALTDNFGRPQSHDALAHARALIDAIASALA